MSNEMVDSMNLTSLRKQEWIQSQSSIGHVGNLISNAERHYGRA